MKMTTKQNNPRKVLFIINNLFGGGAEKVLIHILHHIDRSRFDVHLLLISKEGVYVPQIPEDITLHWIFPGKDDITFSPFRILFRVFRRFSLWLCQKFPALWSSISGINEYYDIGISFLNGYGTSLLTYKRRNFGKIIGWFHSDVMGYDPQISQEQLLRYKDFDKLYFVSDSARQGFLKRFEEFQNHTSIMEVVYNPIDISGIRKAIKQSIPTNDNEDITILAIGRLCRPKRFDKLLNVHKRLLDKGIKHRVCILGEGELREELEQQICRMGIEDSCSLPGFQVPFPYLLNADIFVMTSDYEGLPVVLCEAMLLAKPIVVPDVSGTRELLEDGKYGIIVENNEQAIEEGLGKMISDAGLRALFTERLKENQDQFIFSSAMEVLEEKLWTL